MLIESRSENCHEFDKRSGITTKVLTAKRLAAAANTFKGLPRQVQESPRYFGSRRAAPPLKSIDVKISPSL